MAAGPRLDPTSLASCGCASLARAGYDGGMIGARITETLMMVVLVLASCGTVGPETVDGRERVVIRNDYSTARDRANSDNKRLMVSLLSEVCLVCWKLEREHFKTPAVEALLHDHFVEARFYVDGHRKARDSEHRVIQAV